MPGQKLLTSHPAFVFVAMLVTTMANVGGGSTLGHKRAPLVRGAADARLALARRRREFRRRVRHSSLRKARIISCKPSTLIELRACLRRTQFSDDATLQREGERGARFDRCKTRQSRLAPSQTSEPTGPVVMFEEKSPWFYYSGIFTVSRK